MDEYINFFLRFSYLKIKKPNLNQMLYIEKTVIDIGKKPMKYLLLIRCVCMCNDKLL